MLNTLLNKNFSIADFETILQACQVYVPGTASNSKTLDEEIVLFTRSLADGEKITRQNASELITKLIEATPANHDAGPHYVPALQELQAYINRKKNEEEKTSEIDYLSILFNIAHALAYFEFSEQKNKTPGSIFKDCLSENVAPATRGMGSPRGYQTRLWHYIHSFFVFNEENIRKVLTPVIQTPAAAETPAAVDTPAPTFVPLKESKKRAEVDDKKSEELNAEKLEKKPTTDNRSAGHMKFT